jgi:NAD(P)-dependent dehydrogenase (short-subunit alcohol dehydrogenase family)
MKRDKSFTWRRVDAASLDLKGLKVAIVGGTGGIGRAFSRFMAARGASVVVVGQTFRDSEVPGIQIVKADLSLMREAKRVGQALPAEALDLIIFTTGILPGPKREETAEGIERDMAISYLSRLVIVREIAPRLGKDRPVARMKPRVFIMGFPGIGQTGRLDDLNAEKSYGRWAVHMNTVAGNEMLVLDAAKRYPNASFFGLNPGFIKTNIRTYLFGGDTVLYRFTEWMKLSRYDGSVVSVGGGNEAARFHYSAWSPGRLLRGRSRQRCRWLDFSAASPPIRALSQRFVRA